VAKAFYEDDAPKMVNGVLDHVARAAGRDNEPTRPAR
jgi:N utilization substance protein B